jgi:hypothetical protein
MDMQINLEQKEFCEEVNDDLSDYDNALEI